MTTSDQAPSIFDQSHYLRLIEVRAALIRSLTPQLTRAFGLSTALDVGCGLGFFASLLRDCGLTVTAFDGRVTNVEQARERFPKLTFQIGDIQDPAIVNLGTYDLVLCFGLLYHLENPFLAIRHLRRLTAKGLLLESMCLPGDEPLLQVREEPSLDDQSLTGAALYPSEGCLVKMLYRAGFANVCRINPLPDHEQFRDTPLELRRRTVLFASNKPVPLVGFVPVKEPSTPDNPWSRAIPLTQRISRRVVHFMKKPSREKYHTFAFRWVRRFPLPLKLSFGAWWIARNTTLDLRILAGAFEVNEVRLVQRLVRPGMTVLDVGAHHGFYSLLFSKSVGPQGRVFAFEPSERERRCLRTHLRLNSCFNVRVEPNALGHAACEQDFFLVEGAEDSCNSLRPPAVDAPTRVIRVPVSTLDQFLENQHIEELDFLKMDVEGGEMEVLRGGQSIFSLRRRPIILMEVSDIRTRPWGYEAAEIVDFVQSQSYDWFEILQDGVLTPSQAHARHYDYNLVALPAERKAEVLQALSDNPVETSGPTLSTATENLK